MTVLIVSFSNGHKTIEFAASQHAKKSSSMSIIFSGFIEFLTFSILKIICFTPYKIMTAALIIIR